MTPAESWPGYTGSARLPGSRCRRRRDPGPSRCQARSGARNVRSWLGPPRRRPQPSHVDADGLTSSVVGGPGRDCDDVRGSPECSSGASRSVCGMDARSPHTTPQPSGLIRVESERSGSISLVIVNHGLSVSIGGRRGRLWVMGQSRRKKDLHSANFIVLDSTIGNAVQSWLRAAIDGGRREWNLRCIPAACRARTSNPVWAFSVGWCPGDWLS
jgi:hypothetical protein